MRGMFAIAGFPVGIAGEKFSQRGHFPVMNDKYQRLLMAFFWAAALWGCAKMAGPSATNDGYSPKPVMPPLASTGLDNRVAPVFGSRFEFVGSPHGEVQRKGLFDVHEPDLNQIALLENGEASFAARVQLLKNAKISIRIQALVFSGDETGLYIADILKKKKAAGVDVRVIVDAPSNLGFQTQWMYFDLKQHGVEVQGYESFYLEWINEVPIPFLSPAKDPEAPNHRYHEKLWIVDGETDQATAVAGGLNIANEYFRANPENPDRTWRDQDIIVKGRIVADMVSTFDRNFQHFDKIKRSRGILNTDSYWQATRDILDKTGKIAVAYRTHSDVVKRVERMAHTELNLDYKFARCRFFHNRPRLGETYIKQAYRKLFDNTQREIIICNAYFIPSPDFVDDVRKAVYRGLQVIILTNSPGTNDLPELTMVGRNYYKNLLSINADAQAAKSGGYVQIWEWHGRRYDHSRKTQGTIHAKYAVFDRRYSLVGSYNLDPRSEKLNSETAVVFENKALSTRLAQFFYENDLAYSRQVTMQEANAFKEPTDAIYKLRKEFGSLFESQL